MWLIITAIIAIIIICYLFSARSSQTWSTSQFPVKNKSVTSVIQNLDCSKYITSRDISNIFGLSSNTIINVESPVSTSCRVSWFDPPKNPSVKQLSKGSALFVIGKQTDMDAMISALCKNKFIVGSNSCYTEKSVISNRGVAFEKSNVVVQITQVSVQSVTDQQLSSLAQLISSKL